MTRTDRIMDLTEQWAAQRLAEAGAVELLGDGVALVRDDRDGISLTPSLVRVVAAVSTGVGIYERHGSSRAHRSRWRRETGDVHRDPRLFGDGIG